MQSPSPLGLPRYPWHSKCSNLTGKKNGEEQMGAELVNETDGSKDDLGDMLEKSHGFAEHLLEMFEGGIEWFGGDRPEAAAAAAELAFEHGYALRVLFSVGAPSSAAAMHRAHPRNR